MRRPRSPAVQPIVYYLEPRSRPYRSVQGRRDVVETGVRGAGSRTRSAWNMPAHGPWTRLQRDPWCMHDRITPSGRRSSDPRSGESSRRLCAWNRTARSLDLTSRGTFPDRRREEPVRPGEVALVCLVDPQGSASRSDRAAAEHAQRWATPRPGAHFIAAASTDPGDGDPPADQATTAASTFGRVIERAARGIRWHRWATRFPRADSASAAIVRAA